MSFISRICSINPYQELSGVCIPLAAAQVLKIAILSEKFASDWSWYVDVILNIISQAGDFVSDDVYYRVVQIVTNNEEIQKHAAELVFKVCVRHMDVLQAHSTTLCNTVQKAVQIVSLWVPVDAAIVPRL